MVVLFPQSILSEQEITDWNTRCLERLERSVKAASENRTVSNLQDEEDNPSPLFQWFDKNVPPTLKSQIPDQAIPDVIQFGYEMERYRDIYEGHMLPQFGDKEAELETFDMELQLRQRVGELVKKVSEVDLKTLSDPDAKQDSAKLKEARDTLKIDPDLKGLATAITLRKDWLIMRTRLRGDGFSWVGTIYESSILDGIHKLHQFFNVALSLTDFVQVIVPLDKNESYDMALALEKGVGQEGEPDDNMNNEKEEEDAMELGAKYGGFNPWLSPVPKDAVKEDDIADNTTDLTEMNKNEHFQSWRYFSAWLEGRAVVSDVTYNPDFMDNPLDDQWRSQYSVIRYASHKLYNGATEEAFWENFRDKRPLLLWFARSFAKATAIWVRYFSPTQFGSIIGQIIVAWVATAGLKYFQYLPSTDVLVQIASVTMSMASVWMYFRQKDERTYLQTMVKIGTLVITLLHVLLHIIPKYLPDYIPKDGPWIEYVSSAQAIIWGALTLVQLLTAGWNFFKMPNWFGSLAQLVGLFKDKISNKIFGGKLQRYSAPPLYNDTGYEAVKQEIKKVNTAREEIEIDRADARRIPKRGVPGNIVKGVRTIANVVSHAGKVYDKSKDRDTRREDIIRDSFPGTKGLINGSPKAEVPFLSVTTTAINKFVSLFFYAHLQTKAPDFTNTNTTKLQNEETAEKLDKFAGEFIKTVTPGSSSHGIVGEKNPFHKASNKYPVDLFGIVEEELYEKGETLDLTVENVKDLILEPRNETIQFEEFTFQQAFDCSNPTNKTLPEFCNRDDTKPAMEMMSGANRMSIYMSSLRQETPTLTKPYRSTTLQDAILLWLDFDKFKHWVASFSKDKTTEANLMRQSGDAEDLANKTTLLKLISEQNDFVLNSYNFLSRFNGVAYTLKAFGDTIETYAGLYKGNGEFLFFARTIRGFFQSVLVHTGFENSLFVISLLSNFSLFAENSTLMIAATSGILFTIQRLVRAFSSVDGAQFWLTSLRAISITFLMVSLNPLQNLQQFVGVMFPSIPSPVIDLFASFMNYLGLDSLLWPVGDIAGFQSLPFGAYIGWITAYMAIVYMGLTSWGLPLRKDRMTMITRGGSFLGGSFFIALMSLLKRDTAPLSSPNHILSGIDPLDGDNNDNDRDMERNNMNIIESSTGDDEDRKTTPSVSANLVKRLNRTHEWKTEIENFKFAHPISYGAYMVNRLA